MNITTGQSAQKTHLSMGPKTACNRKISVGKEPLTMFIQTMRDYPQECCARCVAKAKEIQERKK
jgi:hypothetical protein